MLCENILNLNYKFAQKSNWELIMSDDENTDLLLGLGLSLNQARVYLALLKLEQSTVEQVEVFKSTQGRRLQNSARARKNGVD